MCDTECHEYAHNGFLATFMCDYSNVSLHYSDRPSAKAAKEYSWFKVSFQLSVHHVM